MAHSVTVLPDGTIRAEDWSCPLCLNNINGGRNFRSASGMNAKDRAQFKAVTGKTFKTASDAGGWLARRGLVETGRVRAGEMNRAPELVRRARSARESLGIARGGTGAKWVRSK